MAASTQLFRRPCRKHATTFFRTVDENTAQARRACVTARPAGSRLRLRYMYVEHVRMYLGAVDLCACTGIYFNRPLMFLSYNLPTRM